MMFNSVSTSLRTRLIKKFPQASPYYSKQVIIFQTELFWRALYFKIWSIEAKIETKYEAKIGYGSHWI